MGHCSSNLSAPGCLVACASHCAYPFCRMVIRHLVEQHQSTTSDPEKGMETNNIDECRFVIFFLCNVCDMCCYMLRSIGCHLLTACYKHIHIYIQTASICNSYVYAPGLGFTSVNAGCEIWEADFFWYHGHYSTSIIKIIKTHTVYWKNQMP